MTRIRWALLLLVVSALLVGGYGVYRRFISPPEEEWVGQTVVVQQGNLVITAAAFGSISIPQQVNLSFPTAGILDEVGVEVGDRVSQGQVLAQLDEGPLQQAVLQAQVGLKNAALALNKVKEPYSEEDIARQEAAVAEALRSTALALLDLPIVSATGEKNVAEAREALSRAQAAVTDAQRAFELAQQDVEVVKASGNKGVADAREALDKAVSAYSEEDIATAMEAVAEAERSLEPAKQNVAIVHTTGERSVSDAQEAMDLEFDGYRKVMLNYLGEELSDEELLLELRTYFRWVSEFPKPLEDAYEDLMKIKEKLDLATLQADKSLWTARNAFAKAEETLRQARVHLTDMTPDDGDVAKAERSLELAILQADKSLQTAWSSADRSGETLRQAQASLTQLEVGQGVELAGLQAGKSLQAAQNASDRAEDTLLVATTLLADMKAGPDADELAVKELQVSQARFSLKEADADLAAARLLSPFTGVVAEVQAEVGDRVAAGAPAVVLVDPSVVEVSATVDEVDVASIRVGQPAVITMDAIPETTLRGQVKSISPVAQVQQGVVGYPVVISVVTGEVAARPRGFTPGGEGSEARPRSPGSEGGTDVQPREGMSASVEIVVEMRRNVLIVPGQAVRSVQGIQVVALVTGEVEEERQAAVERFLASLDFNLTPAQQRALDEGLQDIARPQAVEVGLSDGRNTEITSGVQEGDEVLLPESAVINPRSGGFGGGGRPWSAR
ncbi:MAG: HlyD family efflux transporter periplasmic adaptor subunit [Dehalococcoidia bacterium]|jgi:HlyD family secretion protein|nr:HlyD family efflux transporter periplasmic adaptor subunit [Dehalococcoidia bacterium]